MSNITFKIWHCLFRSFLRIVNLIYSVYVCLLLAWNFLKNKSLDCIQSQVFDSRELVSRFAKKLEKCPSHFVILLGEGGIQVEDFLNLVTWCEAAKISFVSFYDYTGNFKSIKNIYYECLLSEEKLNPRFLNNGLNKFNPKSGMFSQTQVNIWSLEEGKPLLVQVAKNLAEKVHSQNLKATEINESVISEELYKLLKLPEPDVGVICGSVISTYGFFPWHIRVTEFLQVKSVKGIHVSEFITLLKKYSSCTQRFGK